MYLGNNRANCSIYLFVDFQDALSQLDAESVQVPAVFCILLGYILFVLYLRVDISPRGSYQRLYGYWLLLSVRSYTGSFLSRSVGYFVARYSDMYGDLSELEFLSLISELIQDQDCLRQDILSRRAFWIPDRLDSSLVVGEDSVFAGATGFGIYILYDLQYKYKSFELRCVYYGGIGRIYILQSFRSNITIGQYQRYRYGAYVVVDPATVGIDLECSQVYGVMLLDSLDSGVVNLDKRRYLLWQYYVRLAFLQEVKLEAILIF